MAFNLSSRMFVVGLAGGSASGKSTFSNALVTLLNTADPSLRVELISTDSYFLPNDRIPTFFSPTQARAMPDYNRPDSLDMAEFFRDMDQRCTSPQAPDVLIVEGLMVLHLPEIRERCDLRLFVELDADQRALRRMLRNLDTHNDPIGGINTADCIANYFLESAKVGHDRYVEPSRKYADFILRGDGDFIRTSKMVAGLIRSWEACKTRGSPAVN